MKIKAISTVVIVLLALSFLFIYFIIPQLNSTAEAVITNDKEGNFIVSASQDAYVSFSYPSKNYGSEKYARVGCIYGDLERTFLQFDVTSSDLPSSDLKSAELQLLFHYYSWLEEPEEIAVYAVKEKWDDGSIDWNNQPEFAPEPVEEVTINQDKKGEWISFDITPIYKEWKSGAENFGVVLMSKNQNCTEADKARIFFRTTEYFYPMHHPKLVVKKA
ncbi:MAG: DNRLRE domain-containing protein [Nanoarchaeota archaeon]